MTWGAGQYWTARTFKNTHVYKTIFWEETCEWLFFWGTELIGSVSVFICSVCVWGGIYFVWGQKQTQALRSWKQEQMKSHLPPQLSNIRAKLEMTIPLVRPPPSLSVSSYLSLRLQHVVTICHCSSAQTNTLKSHVWFQTAGGRRPCAAVEQVINRREQVQVPGRKW